MPSRRRRGAEEHRSTARRRLRREAAGGPRSAGGTARAELGLERKLAASKSAGLPALPDPAAATGALGELGGVGEVAVGFDREPETAPPVGVVRQLDVLVHTFADDSGDPDLERALREAGLPSAAGVAGPERSLGRTQDVVAEPSVLLDARERNGTRSVARDRDAIAGKHARLVHDQAVLADAVEEAVPPHREHGSAAARVQRVVARSQLHEVGARREAHRDFDRQRPRRHRRAAAESAAPAASQPPQAGARRSRARVSNRP